MQWLLLFLQGVDGFEVALEAVAFDGLFGVVRNVAEATERFSFVYVGDVDFNGWNVGGFEGIQDGNGGMGVSTWVDDNAVKLFKEGFLNACDKVSFVVALEEGNGYVFCLTLVFNEGVEVLESTLAVDVRFSDA